MKMMESVDVNKSTSPVLPPAAMTPIGGSNSTTPRPSSPVPFSPSSTLTLAFDNLTMTRAKSVVIDNARGIIYGGRLTAVVNCSGTQSDALLLNALTGLEECTMGTIMLNGTPVDAPVYHEQTVLIDEEFLAFEELTVRENIQYAANMRVKDTTRAFTVDDVIAELLLDEVAHRVVRGCPSYVRRRVSLGKELLRNPAVLCLDQPLERLRTHEAQEFLGLLKRIATPSRGRTAPAAMGGGDSSGPLTVSGSQSSGLFSIQNSGHLHEEVTVTSSNRSQLQRRRGRIIIVSMAQPRWALLKYVDDVILMEREHCVFCGTLQELLRTLRTDPASGMVEHAISSLYRLASNSENSLSVAFARSGNVDRVRHHVEQFFHKCASGVETLDGPISSIPGPHVQLFYMFKYDFLQVRNNIVVGGLIFLVVVCLAVLLAAVYNSQEGQSGMQNRIGIIFFLVSSTMLYSVLSLDTQRKEYNSFLRHRDHGYYGACTYLTYAVMSCAIGRLFSLLVLAFVVFCISNIVEKWDYFHSIMQLVLIIGVTSFCSHFVAFFFCAVMWTRRFAMFTLFAVYTLNLLLAGIILNLTTLPIIFQYISNVSIIRLAYESSILSQFIGRDFGCTNITKAETCYTGSQYATFLGFRKNREWLNVGVLAGISGLLILGCLSAMLWHRPLRNRQCDSQ